MHLTPLIWTPFECSVYIFPERLPLGYSSPCTQVHSSDLPPSQTSLSPCYFSSPFENYSVRQPKHLKMLSHCCGVVDRIDRYNDTTWQHNSQPLEYSVMRDRKENPDNSVHSNNANVLKCVKCQMCQCTVLAQSLQAMTLSNTNPLYRRQLEKPSRWSHRSPRVSRSHSPIRRWYCEWQMWHCTVLHPPALTEPPSLATIGSTAFLLIRSTPPTRTDSTWLTRRLYSRRRPLSTYLLSFLLFPCQTLCVWNWLIFFFFYFHLLSGSFWLVQAPLVFLFVAWLGTRQ